MNFFHVGAVKPGGRTRSPGADDSWLVVGQLDMCFLPIKLFGAIGRVDTFRGGETVSVRHDRARQVEQLAGFDIHG